MQEVAYLRTGKHYNRYNSAVYSRLDNAGIKYKLEYTKYGKRVMVSQADFIPASKIILSITF